MKKKALVFFMALAIVLAFVMPAGAAQVYVDGQDLDVITVSENGITLVPLRAIFQSLGATVNWDSETQTITAAKDQTTIKLQIGSYTAYKNGQPVILQVAGKVVSGNTMVPLRFVSESLGANVEWDGAAQIINIVSVGSSSATLPGPSPAPVPTPQPEPEKPVQTGTYVGSQKSDKYHYPDCRWAEKINLENEIWFKDAADAQAHRYVPCGVCKP